MANSATQTDNAQALRESVSTDDISPGGVMPRETFDEFFQVAVEDSEFLDMVRTEEVGNVKTRLPKLGVGERQRRGQAEGARGANAGVETDHIDINCEKGTVHWDLTAEIVENNVAGEDLADTIVNMMSQQFSADTQELAIRGDEEADTGDSDADDFFQQNDGWLKLAEEQGMNHYVHENDSQEAQGVNNALFSQMVGMMPDKYLSRSEPIFLVSMNQMHAYREFLSGNYDSAGFQVLMGDNDVTPFSYDVMGITHWPDDKAMFVDPRNLIYALYRDVEIEILDQTDKTAEEDLYARYFMRAKDDFAIENVDAGVLATGLADPATSA